MELLVSYTDHFQYTVYLDCNNFATSFFALFLAKHFKLAQQQGAKFAST